MRSPQVFWNSPYSFRRIKICSMLETHRVGQLPLSSSTRVVCGLADWSLQMWLLRFVSPCYSVQSPSRVDIVSDAVLLIEFADVILVRFWNIPYFVRWFRLKIRFLRYAFGKVGLQLVVGVRDRRLTLRNWTVHRSTPLAPLLVHHSLRCGYIAIRLVYWNWNSWHLDGFLGIDHWLDVQGPGDHQRVHSRLWTDHWVLQQVWIVLRVLRVSGAICRLQRALFCLLLSGGTNRRFPAEAGWPPQENWVDWLWKTYFFLEVIERILLNILQLPKHI